MTGYSSLKCDVACLTSKGMHYVKSKVGEAPLSRRKADSEPLYNKEELDTWVRQAQDLAAKRDMELRDSAKMERCKRKDLRRQKDEELRFARWRDWDNNSPKQEIKACGLSIGNRSVGDEPKRGDCNSGDFEGGKDGHVEVGNGSEGLEELGGSNKSDEDKCVNHDKDGGKGVQEHGIGGFIESKRAHGDYGGTKDNQGPGIEGVIECSKTGVENTVTKAVDGGDKEGDIEKWNPQVNCDFPSIDIAVTRIKSWAINNGFKMVIRKSEERMKVLKCWCHGAPAPHIDSQRASQLKKWQCKFQINLNAPLDRNGEAYISKIIDEAHTHPLNLDLGVIGAEAQRKMDD
ncbi:hypothetical protein BGX21_005690, partial [Mortierella sp. AD011]